MEKDALCSLYQLYHPIQSRSFILFCDWLLSSLRLANQGLLRVVFPSTLNGACGRSHAHISPATCTRGGDVPSQWGLQYKQGLCPAPMPLQETHRPSAPLTTAWRGRGLVTPVFSLGPIPHRYILANSVDHDTTLLRHDWPGR